MSKQKPSLFCWSALLLSMAGCGGGDSSGGGPVAPPLPGPTARLEVAGGLVFGSCSGPGCSYTIEYENRGSGCANNLRGNVRIYANDVQLESDDWFLDPSIVLLPAATVRVEDCCFSPNNIRLQTRFTSEPFWNNVSCN